MIPASIGPEELDVAKAYRDRGDHAEAEDGRGARRFTGAPTLPEVVDHEIDGPDRVRLPASAGVPAHGSDLLGSGAGAVPPGSPGGTARTGHYCGRITASITWITPLVATMSVLTTLAWSTLTPPRELIRMLWPWTVFALDILTTSAAMTVPGTTW